MDSLKNELEKVVENFECKHGDIVFHYLSTLSSQEHKMLKKSKRKYAHIYDEYFVKSESADLIDFYKHE